jgi:plastocyanin
MRLVAAAFVTALVLPSAASAQTTHVVSAVDTVSSSTWSPTLVQAEQGDVVRWTFAQPGNGSAQPHNVQLIVPGQVAPVPLGDRAANAPEPIDYTAGTLGDFRYFCSIHAQMQGRLQVRVPGTSPTPPPAETGPQGLPNSGGAFGNLEEGDFRRPRLTGVAVKRRGAGVRVRFRLSERGTVTVRFLRRGKAVRTVRVSGGAGTTSKTVRGLGDGAYRVELRAADRAGLRSAKRTARVTIG